MSIFGGTGPTGGIVATKVSRIEAAKVSGMIIHVDTKNFFDILAKDEPPMVIHAYQGYVKKRHRYMLHYQGFCFYTSSSEKLAIPENCTTVEALKIWVPYE